MIPSLVAFELKKSLIEYLSTTYAIGDEATRGELASFLTNEKTGIFRGPYVHIRSPYRRVGSEWTSPLEWTPAGFQPFTHQATAWARLSSFRHVPEPTIVRTGTGSGKTEAFLFPILDHCQRAIANGERGIKALLLYPMNALASDQAGRIAGLITKNPELAGVRAGIYIGDDEGSSGKYLTVENGHLIDNKAEMRANPPDILLTNYKMLDFLLLREGDRELWGENGPDTLTYIVIDELHSYDGAQGTDVAMLLRRLGARLKMNGPTGALGNACPVATSATLGAGDDANIALAEFASRLFGRDVGTDAIVSDNRMTPAEACLPVHYELPIPDLDELRVGLSDDPAELAEAFLGRRIETVEDDDFRVQLGELLLAHPLTRAFVEAASDRPRDWPDAVDRLVVRAPSWGRWLRRDPLRLYAAVADYLALLSIARRVGPTGTEPLFNVQVQLWVREVSRLDRAVSSTPSFQWNDRGLPNLALGGFDAANVGPTVPTLPAIYCRHCGRTGWAAVFQETDGRMSHSGGEIRKHAFQRSPRLRMMISASPGEADATWYDPLARQTIGPALQDATAKVTGAVCVLITPDDAAAKNQSCPSCSSDDAVRFLGTQIASLASVAIGEIFGSPQVDADERKLLAFADSVQDAAHRASFFTARTYRFNLRTLMSAIVREHDGVSVDSLGDQLYAEAEGRGRDVLYGLIPPDLERDRAVATVWKDTVDPAGRKLLSRRLSFEAALEFGLLARVGRTLELTRSAAAEVRVNDFAGLIQGVAESVRIGVPALPLDFEARLTVYLRGLVERFRLRGAIFHPLLDSYIAADGASYHLWGGRAPGAPIFTDRQSRPTFFTDAPKPAGFDAIGRTSGRTWLIDWAIRTLGVAAADAAEVNRRAVAALETFDVVNSRRSASGALVYGLLPSNVRVFDVPSVDDDNIDTDANYSDSSLGATPVPNVLRCNVCSHRFVVPPLSLAAWVGSPCMRFRCTGSFDVAAIEHGSTYRRMYRSGQTRRVVAAEHTGQLSRRSREAVEAAFKNGGGPDSPNVLTCTPTLEMGIDIGDLSAVMLTSIPRGGAASYVQRVGRAGRKTGNALVATFAGSDPSSLYFLDDPLRMIDGEIRPPSCHLDSVEIMQRQYLAFVLDHAAAQAFDAPPMPRDITDVLHKNALAKAATEPTWLGTSIAHSILHPELVDRFLASFGDHVSQTVADRIRDFAAVGIESAFKVAADRWQEELADLERRRNRISERIKTLDAKVHLDPSEIEDLRALRGERGVLGARITKVRKEYTLSALERVGLLPTYTLSDESTELDTVLWSVTDDGEREPQQTSFKRPAQYAIREFAPGNAYYAQGHRFVVDALDVGTGNEPLYETWRLCPDCGYGAPETSASTWTVCPRCQTYGIADLGAQHRLLKLKRVLCIDSEEKARVFDETDERNSEQYHDLGSVDIDTANVVTAFSLEHTTFGVELARNARIRRLNLGAVDRPGVPTTIAGSTLSASKFTTCVHCGVVQGARPLSQNSSIRHLGWCRTRTDQPEKWESLVLAHELVTDAIRMLVPVAAVEAPDRLATFKAVMLIGLRVSFGGDPDHLRVVASTMPAHAGSSKAAGGARRNFIVLYDTVPGGTGYLDRLADPDRLRTILMDAREQIASCPCGEEGLQACHRCLLGVAERREIPLVTRRLALEQIDELLQNWNPYPVATVATLTIDDLEESELERLFRAALVAWDAKRDDVMIIEAPGGRQYGYDLRIGIDGSETRRWRIREQQDIKTSSVTCRPDFLFTRVDGPPLEIAVFTDGERFHASAENNRIADDATKRQALLETGRLVWSLSWEDVQSFHDALTSTTPKKPPLNRLIDKQQAENILSALKPLYGRLSPTIATANSLEQLLMFLADPDPVEWEKFACATISARVVGSASLLATEDAAELVSRAMNGKAAIFGNASPSTAAVAAASFDAATVMLDLSGQGQKMQRWTMLSVMPDGAAVGSPEASALWRSWLGWSNLGQFLRTEDRQFFISATSLADSFDYGAIHVTGAMGSASYSPAAAASASPAGANPVGADAVGLTVDSVTLSYLDTAMRTLLLEVAPKVTAGPEVGFEPNDPKNRGWQIDLAWVDAKIAVVEESEANRDAWLTAEGWTVKPTAEWTPVELADVINRGTK